MSLSNTGVIAYMGQILAMVSSYKLCVVFEGGMLVCLEIIVLDNLKKKGFAWRSFFVSFSQH